jgi:hypothetical protein
MCQAQVARGLAGLQQDAATARIIPGVLHAAPSRSQAAPSEPQAKPGERLAE